jgi:aromatic ring hydroxylase
MTERTEHAPPAGGAQRPLGPGICDGKRYLDSLDDGREVWIGGERVVRIAHHSLFRGLCDTLAGLYDLQHAPATADAMTCRNERGVRISRSYFLPRAPAHLELRRVNSAIWARESFGMLGRYPDFCAAMAIGFCDVAPELAQLDPAFARNAIWHHQYAAENDLCLGHGLHDPNMDKSLRPEQDPDRCLRIVRERDDGLVVRGARFVTLAPVCHELQIAPTYALSEREAEHALWFAIPANTPGVRMVCREPFSARSAFDHPASSRFDEQDALVIFDDVCVPWERVFLARRPLEAHRLFRSRVMAWAVHAGAVQLVARLELLCGVAHLLATTGGIAERTHVQQLLGELVTYRAIFESLLRTSELDCTVTPSGLVAPGPLIVQRAFIGLISERIVHLLEQVGTSALIFLPTEGDFAQPQLRALLDVYFRGRDASALDRTRLCKLAWELTGDSFGGRQQLYERLHSGDPGAILATIYQRHDPRGGVAMVNRLLGTDF